MRLLIAIVAALLLLAPARAQTETPTTEPTATATIEPTATATIEPTATATIEPTATITAIPTVTLDFIVMADEAESVMGDVFASGDEGNPLQYLALSFGGLVIGFFVLAFIADLVWPARD